MTRDQAVDTIMRRLGNWPNTGLRDTIIAEMVVMIQEVLEQDPEFLPWFLLSETYTGSTTTGEERVELPPRFLQEYEDGALYILDDDGDEVEMVRDDLDVIKKKVTGSGAPRYYDIVGEYFIFRKIPDDSYTLKMRFYQADETDLSGSYGDSNNLESLWLKWAADLVIAETGYVIASQYLQSDKMAVTFEKAAIRARARLIKKSTLMEETNKQRFMEG